MPVRNRRRKAATAALSAAGAGRSGAVHPPTLDPIITMNSGGIIQSASDSVEQVFGWTPTELFGRNVSVLIPEPRRSALDRYLDRYRQTDGRRTLTRSRRFDALRKNGSVFPIELSMSRADLPAHSAPFFIGIIRDVSQTIDVGTDPASERTRLHHLITEQTRALATANLRLQMADRLAALGTLAAGLGHDMNNVLLPVRARLNAIEDAGVTSGALVHITAMRRSMAYLQHLSDGLHFLALDPDGPGAADGEGSTDIVQWWRHVGALLRKAVPKHVRIQASLRAGLPHVKIAPQWLTQGVLNLIVNAGESLPEARRRGLIRIWANVTDDGRAVRLGVTDNGRGMTHAVQRRAFDLFFTTKSRGMGTGLGLPLARKVAVRAGGTVELKSEPGKGTTVVLVLPVAPKSAARPAAVGRTAALSIDDHRTAALVTQILVGAGMRVKAVKGERPGASDMWVTEPTARSLAAAQRWRKGRGERMVVLLGLPPKSARASWDAIGATIIDPPDVFEAIRHTLGIAVGSAKSNVLQRKRPSHDPSLRKRVRG